jgi:hypothetical protein
VSSVRVDPADIEAIAHRVAELIRAEPTVPGSRYVDAATLARLLAIDREWVYAHADELGAVRLGGAHGRLRFDTRLVAHTLRTRQAPALRPKRRPSAAKRRRPANRVDLIPYES